MRTPKKAMPSRGKKVMAKKPAAKKVMAKGKVPVQKYQVGGVAAPARTTAATPAARPAPGGMMSRTFMQRGMTPRSTPRVPAQEQSWTQSGMTPEQRAYVQQLQQQRASRPGMPPPAGGGLIPNNPGGMSRGMPTTPAQFEQSLGADRNNYVRNDRGDFFLRPPPGTTPAQAEQMYRAQMARLQAMQQGAGGSMIANNGGGLIPPPNSRPNIPGITPPMNRPVPPPPPRQGMPQGMSPAMQQYAQMMQRRQGMPQQGQMPPMAQGMQGMSAAQGMQQGRGVPSQISDLYGGQRQGMQGMSAAQGMQGMDPRMHPEYQSPETIDLRDPAMAARYGHLLGREPQPLTQEQLQQLQQFGTPLPRFRKGGEAKKKAAAQGRMAKPAGRGRTTKPAVRGRMAKPTRGKK